MGRTKIDQITLKKEIGGIQWHIKLTQERANRPGERWVINIVATNRDQEQLKLQWYPASQKLEPERSRNRWSGELFNTLEKILIRLKLENGLSPESDLPLKPFQTLSETLLVAHNGELIPISLTLAVAPARTSQFETIFDHYKPDFQRFKYTIRSAVLFMEESLFRVTDGAIFPLSVVIKECTTGKDAPLQMVVWYLTVKLIAKGLGFNPDQFAIHHPENNNIEIRYPEKG